MPSDYIVILVILLSAGQRAAHDRGEFEMKRNLKRKLASAKTESEFDAHFRRHWFKEKAKRANRSKRDKLAQSMLYAARIRWDEDDEMWREYGFIMPDEIIYDYDPEVTPTEWDAYLDLTEEEVNEWIGENMWVRIYSDYDCTGKAFTTDITWHRNPSGLISYVHRMALDV